MSRLSLVLGATVASAALVYEHRWYERRLDAACRALREDTLTGLLNETGLYEVSPGRIDTAAHRGRNLLIIYIDLDGFKPVNDRYGHAAGDRLLAETGAAFAPLVSDQGGVSARLHGDEFAAVMVAPPEPSEAWAEWLLYALRDAIRTVTTPDGSPLQASVGAVLASPVISADTDAAKKALKEALVAADTAMYEAKTRRHPVLHAGQKERAA